MRVVAINIFRVLDSNYPLEGIYEEQGNKVVNNLSDLHFYEIIHDVSNVVLEMKEVDSQNEVVYVLDV